MHGKYKQNNKRWATIRLKVLLDSEFSFFEIAKKLNRAPSTITREIQRNTPQAGKRLRDL